MLFHQDVEKEATAGETDFEKHTNTNGRNSVQHRHHYVHCFCILIALFSDALSELSLKFPCFFFPLSCMHNGFIQAAGALIDLSEQSKIEQETGYSSSFCTLSVDPRENKRLRCIQNKEMGKNSPSLREGRGGGGSFTHPQGRSQSLASDLSLKEGNLGEGERNMSEQSE